MKLTAPIVLKNEEKRIAYGPVLVPGEVDHDGDTVTKEQIENVAHDYLANYRIIDVDHKIAQEAVPVESHITREDKVMKSVSGEEIKIPKGTWMMAAKVKKEDQWSRVKSGDLTGFSIMAVRGSAYKSQDEFIAAAKGGEITAKDIKSVTLADLGDSFVVPIVSMVSNPAVPKSKYVAIKSQKEKEENSILQKIWNAVKSNSEPEEEVVEKEGKEISQSNKKELKRALSDAEEIEQILRNLIGTEGGQKSMEEEKNEQVEKEEQTVEAIVKSLGGTLEDISTGMKGLSEKIANIEKRIEEFEQLKEKEEEIAEKEQEEKEETEEEIDTLKSQLDELEETIGAMKQAIIPGTKGIIDQDGGSEETEVTKKSKKGIQRDAMGRNISRRNK